MFNMENKENTNPEITKVTDTLAKEIDSLNAKELQEFFKFIYKMNHNHSNMMPPENFEKFLEAFDLNPFNVNEDKKFRKQLIDNIIKYAFDHMSLITATVLIKKRFTIEELAQNYYASVEIFDGN